MKVKLKFNIPLNMVKIILPQLKRLPNELFAQQIPNIDYQNEILLNFLK